MAGRLILGPAADVLAGIAPCSVDMVYSDPPFGNRQEWAGKAGAFSDKWVWNDEAARGWDALAQHSPPGADLVAAIAQDVRDRAYLACIAAILLQVRRVLKGTGTLWLHFDDTMGAHLRILGEVIFGTDLAFGTVIWKRAAARSSRQRGFARIHDTVAVWGRTRAARWRLARTHSPLVFGDPCFGIVVDGLLEDRLTATAKERVGYPTQKPVSLLKQFIAAATVPGDLVLDPTCGSGTTLVAAEELGRRWVGIDRSADAIAVARARLRPKPQGELFGAAA